MFELKSRPEIGSAGRSGAPRLKSRGSEITGERHSKPASGLTLVELPSLGGVGVVVALALTAEVALEESAVLRTEGLGPVAVLPFEGPRQECALVDVVGGASFEALHEVGQPGGRRKADDDVNMIGRAPGSEEEALEVARLVAEDRGEPGVESRWEERPAPAGRPDDMDKEERRGASGHSSRRPRDPAVARHTGERQRIMETRGRGGSYRPA